MPGTRQWCFGPFRLDPTTESLWRDEVLLPLPPKPFAVLAYLVAHAGQVVSKETLLEAVWPHTAVTEGVLKTCLGQIRQVLGETARSPQYIATLYRRGYRFVAPVVEHTEAVPASTDVPPLETPDLPHHHEVAARPARSGTPCGRTAPPHRALLRPGGRHGPGGTSRPGRVPRGAAGLPPDLYRGDAAV